jgi:hypothetical protein
VSGQSRGGRITQEEIFSLFKGVGGWVIPVAVLDALENGKLQCLTTTTRTSSF